jgi:hypothetical protein
MNMIALVVPYKSISHFLFFDTHSSACYSTALFSKRHTMQTQGTKSKLFQIGNAQDCAIGAFISLHGQNVLK